jgi:hypothetical protein
VLHLRRRDTFVQYLRQALGFGFNENVRKARDFSRR